MENLQASSTQKVEMETIKFLQQHKLEDIEQFNVYYKKQQQHPNLVLFHYNQLIKKTNNILMECRSLILDQSQNWKVVSFPFTKFFDYDDKFGKQIFEAFDWPSAKIYEKFDGCINILYFYQSKWRISSTSMIEATTNIYHEGASKNKSMTDIFWEQFKLRNFKMPEEQDQQYCFIFELLIKDKPILVNIEEDNLILLGVRNVITYQESSHQDFALKYNWNYAKEIDSGCKSLQQALSILNDFDPFKCEGFIAVDKNFHRLKIKTPNYTKFHNYLFCKKKIKMIDFLEIVRSLEDGKYFLQRYPQYQQQYQLLKASLNELEQKIENLVQQYGQNPNYQFENYTQKGLITKIFHQKCKVSNFMKQMQIQKLVTLLNLPDGNVDEYEQNLQIQKQKEEEEKKNNITQTKLQTQNNNKEKDQDENQQINNNKGNADVEQNKNQQDVEDDELIGLFEENNIESGNQ